MRLCPSLSERLLFANLTARAGLTLVWMSFNDLVPGLRTTRSVAQKAAKHRSLCEKFLLKLLKRHLLRADLIKTISRLTASSLAREIDLALEPVSATFGGGPSGWRAAMQIEHRHVDGVTVALLSGRVDSSVADDVTAQLDRLVNAGATRLVVNLKEVSYISSAGLRSIIVAAKLTRSLNGDMRLCEPNALVSKILDASGLVNLIKIDTHEAQSLAALAGQP
jgi:anti-anti-sigma factor